MPAQLLGVDPLFFGCAPPFPSAKAALVSFLPYVERQLAAGVPLKSMSRHLLGLFHGLPGARAFRRHLAIEASKPGAGVRVLEEAISRVVDTGTTLAHIAA